MNNLSKPLLSNNFMLYKDDETNNEFYLLNVTEGNVFELNSASHDFLELCDGKRSCGDIFEILSKMYSTDISTLKTDFSDLYTSWIENGIIEEQ